MSSGSAPILEVRDLLFSWPRSNFRLEIDSLVLDAGETVFLHGPSGCGKSTLLGLIAGTLTAPKGLIRVVGKDSGQLAGWRRDRLRADHMGIVFQQFNLLPFLSMRENVVLPCRFSARRAARAETRYGSLNAAADALLTALGLDTSARDTHRAMDLSVGQQQRVAVARALIGSPELVIADEPTSALDADARNDFLKLLFAECERAHSALLFVSHDLALAGRFQRSASLAQLSPPAAQVVACVA